MPYQAALIQRAISRAHLQHGVAYVDGWQSRGSSTFNPRGVVCHHDASSTRSGDNGALNIIIHGRSGLPGPLSQFQIARMGRLWVVAAGRANHAGSGGWRGLVGNSSVFGIETANNGVGEHWSPQLLDTYYRLVSALLEELRQPTSMAPAHREWTARKIDPAFRSPSMSMDYFRLQVDKFRQGAPVVPAGPPITERSEAMYKFYQATGSSQIWAVSGGGYGFHLTPSLYNEMRGGPAMLSDVVHRVSPGQLNRLTAGKFSA